MRSDSRVACALAAVLLACSSKAPENTPSPAATTYTQGYCERLDRCQTVQARENFGSVDECVTRVAPDTDDEFRSPGTTITADQASACATAMRQAPCDVLTSALPECQFVGTLDAGAPCGSGYQCKTGSCFRTTDGGTLALCGTCSPRVPEGSDCTKANCQSGLLCASGRCKALADVGGGCGDAQPCKPNLQCAQGKCQQPLGAGAACTPPAAAATDVVSCDGTQLLVCVAVGADSAAGTCVAVRYAAVGESCGLDPTKKQLVSCGGSSCSDGSAGTCSADLKEGDACSSDGPPCEVPLGCIDGRCGRTSIASCQ
jgi:hypothetical protein